MTERELEQLLERFPVQHFRDRLTVLVADAGARTVQQAVAAMREQQRAIPQTPAKAVEVVAPVPEVTPDHELPARPVMHRFDPRTVPTPRWDDIGP